jgi:hypothetical protein
MLDSQDVSKLKEGKPQAVTMINVGALRLDSMSSSDFSASKGQPSDREAPFNDV